MLLAILRMIVERILPLPGPGHEQPAGPDSSLACAQEGEQGALGFSLYNELARPADADVSHLPALLSAASLLLAC